mmetsp:Transcript_11555/g.12404  ORF Transcript_11555/g.12404 Transcript_11555/m.12404 type:complete len:1059 (-) Transcript_11555:164-3340(-)
MTNLFDCVRRIYVVVVIVIVILIVLVGCTAKSDAKSTTKDKNLFDNKQIFRDTTAEGIDTKQLDCGIRSLALDYAKKIILDKEDIDQKENYDYDIIIQAVHDALELKRLCEVGMFKENGKTQQMTNDLEWDIPKTTATTFIINDEAKKIDDPEYHHRTADTKTKVTNEVDDDKYAIHLAASCNDSISTNDNDMTVCIFVSAQSSELRDDENDEDGSRDHPWLSVHQALNHVRLLTGQNHQKRNNNNNNNNGAGTKIVLLLRQGVHYLRGRPMRLSNLDNADLTIRGYPGEEVWISGGVKLKNVVFKKATPYNIHHADGVYVADLSDVLKGHDIPNIPSLFTSSRRYIRARYPDGDPEINQWGYRSPHHFDYSIRSDEVLEWAKPKPGIPPTFTFIDFAKRKNLPPDIPTKNNSKMDGYNVYASGHGGVCSEIWGNRADSYWCSNSSEGGWAEVDRECAISGQMQLPIGMTYNSSSESLIPVQNASSSLKGGMVHAWHSQSWAMHMFEITSHSQVNATMTFAKGGGAQGGRNWCRCDQCTYAGKWCGQHKLPPKNDDTRLISGDWMIENVKYFLDQPGEYFFDKETLLLYTKPNSTDDLQDLTLGLLTELVDLRNATNIRIENLSFRHQASTYMEEGWSAPSGGDWSLRRGGAIFIENASNITVSGCNFFRLDGNAIFLSRRTRHVHIEYNHFEWIGENAIATWGDTDAYDATAGEYPMYTLIQHNIMRELGIYEKQSSAVGISKAALTTIRNNIMFNMARAAINFNDLVGGGDVVEGNLIFNTCRESGDHGPINSWDRQPYLTNLRDGKTNSFDPLPRIIRHNFIFANYNAAQGVDNDDGSSWFHIHHNLFYMAEGFKMDYGGHDSIFEYNMVMSFSYHSGPCFGMGTFLEGHGDILRGNRCLVGLHYSNDDDERNDCEDNNDSSCYTSNVTGGRKSITARSSSSRIPTVENDSFTGTITNDNEEPSFVGKLYGGCEDSHVTLVSNEYYTPDGIALIACNNKDFYTLNDMETKFGLEVNSTCGPLPEISTILDWATSIAMKQQQPSAQQTSGVSSVLY